MNVNVLTACVYVLHVHARYRKCRSEALTGFPGTGVTNIMYVLEAESWPFGRAATTLNC